MSLRRPGSLRWLQPGLHIKRWLLLMGLGVAILSFGAAYAVRGAYASDFRFTGVLANLRYLTLAVLPNWMRALIFATLGIGLLLVSLRQLSRAMLVPFLKGGEDLADVYYKHRTITKGPRVVALGGGTGLSALLRGLKEYTGNLTAIVTVADDGGSSGKLREQYRILPPGDFRQCLTALAETEPLMTQLFQHRFSEGALDGHAFGNLFIMAMAEITGDFEHALRESGKVLAVRGTILPSTLHDVVLVAELEDGQEAVGESRIPLSMMPIRHVYLEPRHALINPEAEQAILDAELITVGPGSLYTSILPNLLVEGMISTLKYGQGAQGLHLQRRHPEGRDRPLHRRRPPRGPGATRRPRFVRLRPRQLQPQLPAAAVGPGGRGATGDVSTATTSPTTACASRWPTLSPRAPAPTTTPRSWPARS